VVQWVQQVGLVGLGALVDRRGHACLFYALLAGLPKQDRRGCLGIIPLFSLNARTLAAYGFVAPSAGAARFASPAPAGWIVIASPL
jgi:hypothetical protein